MHILITAIETNSTTYVELVVKNDSSLKRRKDINFSIY